MRRTDGGFGDLERVGCWLPWEGGEETNQMLSFFLTEPWISGCAGSRILRGWVTDLSGGVGLGFCVAGTRVFQEGEDADSAGITKGKARERLSS